MDCTYDGINATSFKRDGVIGLTCRGCAIDKPLDCFRPSERQRRICKQCSNRKKVEREKRRKPAWRCLRPEVEEARLAKAKAVQEAREARKVAFIAERGRREARRVELANDRVRASAKERERAKEYGLSVEQLRDLYRRCDSRCLSCGDPEGAKKLNIDHCHDSGRVRGLLCHPCNTTLGFMRDSPERILQLYNYAVAYCQKEPHGKLPQI